VHNTTALVFWVMLAAQRAALEEKRDCLRALKMYAGMLEDLNGWLARVVVPAQRAVNAKIKEGNLKDSLSKRTKTQKERRQERMEATIDLPSEVDTQWGAVDEATGRVFIPGLRDTATQPTRVDAQELATLIAQTDQWRATLQNNQTKQSMDFQRVDSAMNNTWNMLTAFLKGAQDGTNAIIRNGLG
jgi:transcriptional regulator of heat shock response